MPGKLALFYILFSFQGFLKANGNPNYFQSQFGPEDEILNGIEEMRVIGAPGFLTIYGNSTTSILAGQRWDWEPKVYHGMIAANSLGNGRIIGCSHTSFLDPYPEATPDQPGEFGTNQFLLNSARWISGVQSPVVLIISSGNSMTLETFLNNSGMSATSMDPSQFSSSEDLIGFDAVFTSDPINEIQAAILLEFVEQSGGGLLMALTAWAYSDYTNAPGHFGILFPPNQISARAGFVWRNGWGDGYAEPGTPSGNYNVSSDFVKNINTRQVWPEINNVLNGLEGSEEFNQNPNQFISIVEMDLKSIPPNDPFFSGEYYQEMREFVLDMDRQPVPTPEDPIKTDNDKLVAHMFTLLVDLVLEPEEIKAHPASFHFPGTINEPKAIQDQVHNFEFRFQPKSFSSESHIDSENRWHDPDWRNPDKWKQPIGPFEDVEMNHEHGFWFTTGLYAGAGDVIQVKITSTNPSISYGAQIGCHTDDISRHETWPRLPIITRRIPVSNNDIKFASPYGGLIYIVRPEQPGETEEVINVSIIGAYKAPVFKLGQTSLKKWREEIRYYGAPWAEFESKTIILSAPSASAVQIDDPESLMLFWDLVMDAITDLISIPRHRYRQERMVPDILISVGFMHSGYPIMTFLPEGDLAINLTRMRLEGSWGHFHELGHNFQKSAWTFSGTGEVTCNFFSLYVFNTILGLPGEKGHEMLLPEMYKPKIADYMETGTEFTQWQSDAFLALYFYFQLQQEYGWEAYKTVFARYNDLNPVDEPQTDQEKIDLWLVMFSSVTGENLGPFFTSWGIPFTIDALDEISHLPEAPIRIHDMIN